jgi:preprotein translocase subunit SecA
MRVFASDLLKRVMGTFKIPEDEPIASPMISRSLETAQKRIEGFNFDSRKQVLAYDDVMNTQRLAIYERRRTALLGTPEDIDRTVREIIGGDEETLHIYEARRDEVGHEVWTALLRRLILQVTDTFWLEHLDSMEYLRRSVSLRAYGQRDPLQEYRREGLGRYEHMLLSIDEQVRSAIPHVRPTDEAKFRAEEARTRARLVAASEGSDESVAPQPVVKQGEEFGRNDVVTIRKGDETQTLKYKKAEPLLAEGWVMDPDSTSRGTSTHLG